MNCRSCGGQVDKFLDLGHQPPADGFLSFAQLGLPETFYPLEVYSCEGCALVQIGYVVPPDELFNKDYPYETGVNVGGVRHFAKFANDVFSRFNPKFVIDVGSNDGTLLSGFKESGCRVLGVEPCAHIALKANKSGILTVPMFWGDEFEFPTRADVITAANVFAHVADVHAFMRCVDRHLEEDGVFIIESPYLADMIEKCQFDTVYHEHIYYWSLKPLSKIVGEFGMEVFDTEYQTVHGGSMRYFICRRGKHDYQKRRMRETQFRELGIKLNGFSARVKLCKDSLVELIKGKNVVGIGAPAKGNTLLNYCQIDLPGIVEKKDSPKIGHYTPGRHIPVLDEDVLCGKFKNHHALILAWNWKDEIMENLRGIGFRGDFIIPVPEPYMVGSLRGEHE